MPKRRSIARRAARSTAPEAVLAKVDLQLRTYASLLRDCVVSNNFEVLSRLHKPLWDALLPDELIASGHSWQKAVLQSDILPLLTTTATYVMMEVAAKSALPSYLEDSTPHNAVTDLCFDLSRVLRELRKAPLPEECSGSLQQTRHIAAIGAQQTILHK